MDLLDRLLGHDVDTTRAILLLCRSLDDEQLDREFDIGHGSLRRILAHVVRNIEVWTDLMMQEPVRPETTDWSVGNLILRLEVGYAAFSALAREAQAAGRLDDLWTDVLDDPPTEKSFGGGIGHVITHNMHHRAAAIHVLRRLGVAGVPEGDLMGWDRRRRIEACASPGPA